MKPPFPRLIMIQKYFFFLLLLISPLFALEPLVPDDNAAHITRTLVRVMPQAHMNREPFTEAMARRTLQNYLRALDFDRTVFMAQDVEEFRGMSAGLHAQLLEGNLELPFYIFNRFRERAQDRVNFVFQMLENNDFDFETEEFFVWRRRDAAWASGQEEWDALWRKRVQNELVGHKVSARMREIELEEEAAAEAEAAEAGEVGDEVADADAGADAGVDVEEAAPVRVLPVSLDLSPTERVRRRYVQFIEVINGHDAEFVQQMFLSSLTRAFDAHSTYMSPRANEDFEMTMRLSLTGIGAILETEDGAARVQRLMKGGPAARDGRLQPGDRIIAVGQGDEEVVDILFWPLYRSVRLIRGEIGTTVVLHVIPATDPTGTEVRVIDLVRDEIKLEENAARSHIHEKERGEQALRLGIIHLPDFYRDFGGERSSAADVRALLEELNEANVDGLVLDLRNNGGGSLQDAVEMSGFFIDSGPIVQVRSEGGVRVLADPRRGVVFNRPVVVLVNRQSASASEILAAALQDYGRAVIVGDSKTHGKGSVQTLIPLDRRDPSLGSLRVTTAAFYRIDGRSTQLKGVSPDIEIRSPADVMEMGEEFLENVLPWTWVSPSRFMPFGSLRDINEQLRERSAARLAAEEEFVRFQQQIDRLAERVQRREISLNFEQRLEQAQADRKLDRLQERGMMLGEAEEEEEDEDDRRAIRPDRDLILREGLQILADLIELQGV